MVVKPSTSQSAKAPWTDRTTWANLGASMMRTGVWALFDSTIVTWLTSEPLLTVKHVRLLSIVHMVPE